MWVSAVIVFLAGMDRSVLMSPIRVPQFHLHHMATLGTRHLHQDITHALGKEDLAFHLLKSRHFVTSVERKG